MKRKRFEEFVPKKKETKVSNSKKKVVRMDIEEDDNFEAQKIKKKKKTNKQSEMDVDETKAKKRKAPSATILARDQTEDIKDDLKKLKKTSSKPRYY